MDFIPMMLKSRHFLRYWLLVFFVLLLLLTLAPPVSAEPLGQEDDPATLCAEGVELAIDGQHAEALPLLEAGFAGREEGNFVDPDDLGVCAVFLGILLYNTGDPFRARQAYDIAYAQFQESGNDDGKGWTLVGIGQVYANQGRYDAALDHYQQALIIFRDVDDRLLEGQTLNYIGTIYAEQGHYDKALTYYQQVLVMLRDLSSPSLEGETLNNIGSIYYNQGRYPEALEYLQRAWMTHREDGDRLGVGITLGNIGEVYRAQGRSQDALDHYRQAMTIQREENDLIGVGITLNNICAIYYTMRRYDESLRHCREALITIREVGDRSTESFTLNNIGQIYSAQKYYEDALDSFQKALIIVREINNRTVEGITLNNIGRLYHEQEQYAEALDYFQQALNVLDDVRATAGSDEARASFISSFEEQSNIYDATIIAAHHLDELVTAFHTSERGRARTFLDSLSTGHVQLADNEASELLERESTLYAERQATQDALAQARAADPPDTDLIADLEADLEQLEADYAAVQEEIAARGDQLAALVPGRSAVPKLAEIQAAIDADTTLLSYWVTDEQTFAFVVTQDGLEVIELEATRDDLLDQVETLRRFSDLGEPYPAAAVELHEMLIAPLAEHLTTKHLAIVPHDVLHYLPFAALSDGERFLVDDYTLTLLPSASSLLHIRQNTGNELTAPLVLGNPATDNDELPALTGAEAEAETIATLYDSAPLLGEMATEAEVRDRAAEAGILHIAAHGAFEQAAPLESTLYLTPEGDDDGRLTVREIYALDLQQADLVVLSACETQIDDTGIVHGQLSVDSGDELVGLTRAFFYAGTPSVVSTLWRVEDEPSALLMERFYTHLQDGMGKAEALRQAQMDVREQHPNPYYWAGYVLSGEAGEPEPFDAFWLLVGGIGALWLVSLVVLVVAGRKVLALRRRA
jgi:CHAT domain-containing protein/predicted negative regulator of RcsB-dependent stress response